ncbi:hypothetical protein D3C85_565290 [compost metagenome]
MDQGVWHVLAGRRIQHPSRQHAGRPRRRRGAQRHYPALVGRDAQGRAREQTRQSLAHVQIAADGRGPHPFKITRGRHHLDLGLTRELGNGRDRRLRRKIEAARLGRSLGGDAQDHGCGAA